MYLFAMKYARWLITVHKVLITFVLLITRLLRLVGKLSARKPSGVAVVTPTDCPKSVCNRCVIEVFGRVFVLSRCFLDFSVGVGAFVIGLSQISSFFSNYGQQNPQNACLN